MGITGSKMARMFFLGGLLLAVALWVPLNGSSAALTVSPGEVQIGAWYDGARIRVQASIPDGCEAVMELTGKPAETRFLRKEKHWGMWKSEREILERGAPALYLAMSTASGMLTEQKPSVAWGYGALAERISFKGTPPGITRRQLFDEFLRFMESRGLYGLFPGGAKTQVLPGGGELVKGDFDLPARVAQGRYRVTLSVVKNGRVISRETKPLTIELAGFPAAVFHLAHKHPLAYGILAAVVAILGGFFVGLVFQMIGKSK